MGHGSSSRKGRLDHAERQKRNAFIGRIVVIVLIGLAVITVGAAFLGFRL